MSPVFVRSLVGERVQNQGRQFLKRMNKRTKRGFTIAGSNTRVCCCHRHFWTGTECNSFAVKKIISFVRCFFHNLKYIFNPSKAIKWVNLRLNKECAQIPDKPKKFVWKSYLENIMSSFLVRWILWWRAINFNDIFVP